MPIANEFIYTVAPGSVWISLSDWVKTLPDDQQTEFCAAKARQRIFRSQAIDQGNLAVISNTSNDRGLEFYIWKDDAAEKLNKPHDPIWDQYFYRYLKENNITLTIIKREI